MSLIRNDLNFSEIAVSPPSGATLANLLAGTFTASVTGYFAIILLLDVIKRNRLPWFGYYCLLVAFTGLALIHVT